MKGRGEERRGGGKERQGGWQGDGGGRERWARSGRIAAPRPRVRLQRAAGREGFFLGKPSCWTSNNESAPSLAHSPCKVKEDLFLGALGSFPALTSCQPPLAHRHGWMIALDRDDFFFLGRPPPQSYDH